jgi:DNA-binding phage protein
MTSTQGVALGWLVIAPLVRQTDGQARVVIAQALEEEQQRIVASPLKFVANLANLLQVAVRAGG